MNIKIGIVLLNYNNVTDTIHALQSIVQAQNSNNHVLIVVDNASTDNSCDILKSTTDFEIIAIEECNQAKKSFITLPKVHLLQSSNNNGYATGNNYGIKQCLLDVSISHIWVLNNDVEIKEDCILAIEKALQNTSKINSIGIWGTLLVQFDAKNHLQALAGKYYPLLAKTKLYLPNLPLEKLENKLVKFYCKKANYFIGASLIFSKAFLDQVGLFNEQYFLYAEEIDIFLRGKKKGFEKLIISEALVYHKEGSTTKSTNVLSNFPSTFIEFHNCRSKLIFTKNYYPLYYPFVYILISINLIWIFRQDFKKAFQVFKSLKNDLYTT